MGEQVGAGSLKKSLTRVLYIERTYLMGGDKGETCDVLKKNEKDVLTYFSRVVLFHITGFYQ